MIEETMNVMIPNLANEILQISIVIKLSSAKQKAFFASLQVALEEKLQT
jgi:hypothetical protein